MTIALELPILAHRSAIGVDVDEVSSKMLGSCFDGSVERRFLCFLWGYLIF